MWNGGVFEGGEPSKLNMTSFDYLIIICLSLIPVLIFSNVLKSGYISYYDLTIPSSWMKIYPSNFFSYLNGENATNSFYAYKLTSSLSLISLLLYFLFGSNGIHLADLVPLTLLGPFAYIFSRYFVKSKVIGIVIAIFFLFNPYTMILTLDSISNIYSSEFILPFFITYIELRLYNKKKLAPLVILILSIPSIYGITLVLYFGTMVLMEMSFLVLNAKNLRDYFKQFIIVPIIILTYLIININDLIGAKSILVQIGLNNSASVPPNYDVFSIITLQAVYFYENGLTVFFNHSVVVLLEIIILIILSILFSIYILSLFIHKLFLNKKVNFLAIFIPLFFIFSMSIMSMGSNYLYINKIISYFFPEIYYIDPWDNGIFIIFTISILLIFGSLSFPISQINTDFTFKSRMTIMRKFALAFFHSRKLLTVSIFLILLFSSFYIATNYSLNQAYSPEHIPQAQEQAYKSLENDSCGFAITVPTTYAITFNYSNHSINLFGKKVIHSAATFFWNNPPIRIYESGKYYSQIVNSLYNTNNNSTKNEFDSLATICGIHYLIYFNASNIVNVWASSIISYSNITKKTDFQLSYKSKSIDIFTNPYYRGLSYGVNCVIISNHPSQATLEESRLNLTIPTISFEMYSNISKIHKMKALTFNESIYKQSGRTISLIIPFESNVYIYPNKVNLTPPYLISSLNKENIIFKNVNDFNLSAFSNENRIIQNLTVFTLKNSNNDLLLNESNGPFLISNFSNAVISINIIRMNNKSIFFTLGNITIAIQPQWKDLTIRITGTGTFDNEYLSSKYFNNPINVKVEKIGTVVSLLIDNTSKFSIIDNSSKSLIIDNHAENLSKTSIAYYNEYRGGALTDNKFNGFLIILHIENFITIESFNYSGIFNQTSSYPLIKTSILYNGTAELSLPKMLGINGYIIFTLLTTYGIIGKSSIDFGISNNFNILVSNKSLIFLKELNDPITYNLIYTLGIIILSNIIFMQFIFLRRRHKNS